MTDTTGQNEIHRRVAALMEKRGHELLGETVWDVAERHVLDESTGQCRGCLAEWPCSSWIDANDRLVRWLIDQLGEGEA